MPCDYINLHSHSLIQWHAFHLIDMYSTLGCCSLRQSRLINQIRGQELLKLLKDQHAVARKQVASMGSQGYILKEPFVETIDRSVGPVTTISLLPACISSHYHIFSPTSANLSVNDNRQISLFEKLIIY